MENKFDYAIKCSSSDGKCFSNLWYWLVPDMSADVVNYTIMQTDYSSYSLVYQCTQSWMTMWTSIQEEFTIKSKSQTLDSTTVSTLKSYIDSTFPHYDQANVL